MHRFVSGRTISHGGTHINDLISHIFYGGRLRVAADVKEDEGWLRRRSLSFSGIGQGEHVHLLAVEENGVWSAKYRGPIRYPSADKIASLIKQARADRWMRMI